MDIKLRMLPIEMGGTVILDFDPDLEKIYKETIIRTGREDLVICSRPFIIPGYFSLHIMSQNFDLKEFFQIYSKLMEEHNTEL